MHALPSGTVQAARSLDVGDGDGTCCLRRAFQGHAGGAPEAVFTEAKRYLFSDDSGGVV